MLPATLNLKERTVQPAPEKRRRAYALQKRRGAGALA